jgi:hypothetical protein
MRSETDPSSPQKGEQEASTTTSQSLTHDHTQCSDRVAHTLPHATINPTLAPTQAYSLKSARLHTNTHERAPTCAYIHAHNSSDAKRGTRHTHTHARTHAHTHTHTHTHTSTHARTHARTHAHTHTRSCTCMVPLSNSHKFTPIHLCLCTRGTQTHARTHTHTHTRSHTHTHTYDFMNQMCACIMCEHIHKYARTRACSHTGPCTCTQTNIVTRNHLHDGAGAYFSGCGKPGKNCYQLDNTSTDRQQHPTKWWHVGTWSCHTWTCTGMCASACNSKCRVPNLSSRGVHPGTHTFRQT